MTISRMYCTQCGNEGIDIPRSPNQQREGGHLKKIYCLHCRSEQNHVEIRPFGEYKYEDFLLEFENGNFNKEGERILPYGKFRDTLEKQNKLDELLNEIYERLENKKQERVDNYEN